MKIIQGIKTHYNYKNMNKHKILCVGLGKLGLVFSQVVAEKIGNTWGYDINQKVISSILNNKKSIEPKLNYLLNKNKKKFNEINLRI